MSAGDDEKLRPEDLADLEAVARRLDEAGGRAGRDLHHRVRSAAAGTGLSLEEAPSRALSMLLSVAGLDDDSRPGARLARAYQSLRASFVAVGIVAGAVATTGVLIHDGARPVNVLSFLSVLVGLQLLLLLLLVLSLALGRRLEAVVPPLGWLRRAVSAMRERLARRGIEGATDETLAGEGGPSHEESLYAGIDRWRSVALMQWLAIGFNLGIVVALLGRLAVTDVVFGWSTTLPSVARLFPSIVEALALPWAAWMPAAVPDAAVVEATRYVRIGPVEVAWAGGPLGPDVLLFSGWWQFLLAAVLAYGLVPRLLMLALCSLMVRRRLGWAVNESRRLRRLRQRIAAPVVEVEAAPADLEPGIAKPAEAPVDSREAREVPGTFQKVPGTSREAPREMPADSREVPGTFQKVLQKVPGTSREAPREMPGDSPAALDDERPDLGPSALVLWGDVPDPGEPLKSALRSRMGAKVVERLDAGGLSFEATQAAIEKLCTGGLSRMPVVLVAEGYEAPAEELERFLQAIRRGGDPGRVVVVALADVLEEGGWTEARPEDMAMWRSGLRRLPGTGAHLIGPIGLPAPEACS